jgi:UDP-galactopyranose mutase
MSPPDDVLIIGAGPAGLAVSYGLRGRARILEQDDAVGGLCRSIEFGGAVFDIGGHSFHSPHAEVLALVQRLMAGRWNAQQRDAQVWVGGQLIAYPFQQNFDQLSDQALVASCREGLVAADGGAAATNLEDWIVHRFGEGIARHFMLPYNRKLWARDLRGLSHEWVGERISGAAPESAVMTGGQRRPLQGTSEVGYPAVGGFDVIFKALAEQCGPIELRQTVVEIDPQARLVRTADGRDWPWRRLVSTLPLPRLLAITQGCPAALLEDASRLEFVSLKVLMIRLDTRVGSEPQRVYVADPAVPPHKIAFNHTSSRSLRGRPTQAVMAEIAYGPEKLLASERELEKATLDWLVEARLIPSHDRVVETRFVDAPYAYPAPTPAREAIVRRAQAWLSAHDISTLGRFGLWAYVNSDACLHQGLGLAARLAETRE